MKERRPARVRSRSVAKQTNKGAARGPRVGY
jgi:hypothetical protein